MAHYTYTKWWSHPCIRRNVAHIKPAAVPQADLWWMSPPCQPYSIRGRQQDLADRRSGAYLRLLELLDAHRPQHIALENVPWFEGSQGLGVYRLPPSVFPWSAVDSSWSHRRLTPHMRRATSPWSSDFPPSSRPVHRMTPTSTRTSYSALQMPFTRSMRTTKTLRPRVSQAPTPVPPCTREATCGSMGSYACSPPTKSCC
jgi:hypothetical protein